LGAPRAIVVVNVPPNGPEPLVKKMGAVDLEIWVVIGADSGLFLVDHAHPAPLPSTIPSEDPRRLSTLHSNLHWDPSWIDRAHHLPVTSYHPDTHEDYQCHQQLPPPPPPPPPILSNSTSHLPPHHTHSLIHAHSVPLSRPVIVCIAIVRVMFSLHL